MKNQCCWVLSACGKLPVDYCRKPTGWNVVKDEDSNKMRKYRPFCAEHAALAKAQDEAEETK